jgi:hypothetical protein
MSQIDPRKRMNKWITIPVHLPDKTQGIPNGAGWIQ